MEAGYEISCGESVSVHSHSSLGKQGSENGRLSAAQWNGDEVNQPSCPYGIIYFQDFNCESSKSVGTLWIAYGKAGAPE